MECGQCGAPGVPAVFPVVVEFKSNRENVLNRHPAMGELTALEIFFFVGKNPSFYFKKKYKYKNIQIYTNIDSKEIIVGKHEKYTSKSICITYVEYI